MALLGAESTGKTWLADALVRHLVAAGRPAVGVPEVLRDWCIRHGRTPRADEQQAIAVAQQDAIATAAAACGTVVVADTTPLMTAVYSDLLFGDRALYPFALSHLRSCAAVLLTGLDLPWVADGLQRDGPQVRAPVDARLRTVLEAAGIEFQVVYGQGEARLAHALSAIDSIATSPASACASGTFPPQNRHPPPWQCAHCGDADCERRLFTRLRGG